MGRLSSCVGIILAGGQSRRFGKPKAWAEIGESSFVERLYSLFNEVFEKTYVVLHEASSQGLASPSRPEKLSAPPPQRPSQISKMNTIFDLYPEGGPMNGIYSALVATQAPAIFVCACDLPLIREEDIENLLSQWEPNLSALVYHREKHWEPLCGIYNRKLIRVLPKFLESGFYRLQDFLNQVGAKSVSPLYGSPALLNINTPDDYQKLKQKHFSTFPLSNF